MVRKISREDAIEAIKIILKIKESQINFYAGEFKSAGDSLIQVLKDLPRDAPRYNDLLDVQSIILAFTESKLPVGSSANSTSKDLIADLANATRCF